MLHWQALVKIVLLFPVVAGATDFSAHSPLCKALSESGASTHISAEQGKEKCKNPLAQSALLGGEAAKQAIQLRVMLKLKDQVFSGKNAQDFFTDRVRAAAIVGSLPSDFAVALNAEEQSCNKSQNASAKLKTDLHSIFQVSRAILASPPHLSSEDRNNFERRQYIAMMEVARLSRLLQQPLPKDGDSSERALERKNLLAILQMYPAAAQFVNASQSSFEDIIRTDRGNTGDKANEILVWRYLQEPNSADFASAKAYAEALENPSLAFKHMQTILHNKNFPYEGEIKTLLKRNLLQSVKSIGVMCEATPCLSFALEPSLLSDVISQIPASDRRESAREVCACDLYEKTNWVPPDLVNAMDKDAAAMGVGCLATALTPAGAETCGFSAGVSVVATALQVPNSVASIYDRWGAPDASAMLTRVASSLPGSSPESRLQLAGEDAENATRINTSLAHGSLTAGMLVGGEALKALSLARSASQLANQSSREAEALTASQNDIALTQHEALQTVEELTPAPLRQNYKPTHEISEIEIPSTHRPAQPIPHSGKAMGADEVPEAGIVVTSKKDVAQYLASADFRDGDYVVLVAKNPRGGPDVVLFSPRHFPGVEGMEGKIVTHRSLVNRFRRIFGQDPEVTGAGESLVRPTGLQDGASNQAGTYKEGNTQADYVGDAMDAVGFHKSRKFTTHIVEHSDVNVNMEDHLAAKEVATIDSAMEKDVPQLLPKVQELLRTLVQRYRDPENPSQLLRSIGGAMGRAVRAPDPAWSEEKRNAYAVISNLAMYGNGAGSRGTIIFTLKNGGLNRIDSLAAFQQAMAAINRSTTGSMTMRESLKLVPKYLDEYLNDIEPLAREWEREAATKAAAKAAKAAAQLNPGAN